MRLLSRFRRQGLLILGAACLSIACPGGESLGTNPPPPPPPPPAPPPPPPTPSLTISLSSASLDLLIGASGQTQVNLVRTNLTSGVTLLLEGAPAGVTGAFAPATPTGDASTLTITVAAAAAAGSYQLAVRAQAAGLADRTVQLTLTLSAVPGFRLTLAPPTPSLATGGSGVVQVTIIRTNFTGAVTFTLAEGGGAVTGGFNPAVTSGNQSTLTLTVHASAQVGVHNLAVVGTATGAATQTAALPLSVTASGGFVLTTTPSGFVNLAQSGNAPVTINVVRTGGFLGIVAFNVTGAVAGLTATLQSPQTPDNALLITFAASGTLALGSYPLTIRGTSAGVPDRTVDITVNVASSSVGSIVFDYSTCPAPAKPLWFAIQDGDGGPWQRVVPANERYAFDLTDNRSAVATVFAGAQGGNTVRVEYLALAEIQARGAGSPCTAAVLAGLKTLTGTVANVGAGEQATISLGGSTAVATMAAPGFQLQSVAEGIQDLVAVRSPQSGAAGSDRGLFIRDLDLSDNGSVGTIDLGDNNTFLMLPTGTTLTGLTGAETVTQSLSYLTRSACTAAPVYAPRPVTGNSFTAYYVPDGLQRTTDRHALSVVATTGNTSIRTITGYFRIGAVSRTLELPGELTIRSVAVEPGSFKRLRIEGTTSGILNLDKSFSYSDGANAKTVSLSATAAWLGTALSNPAFETPDFSTIPGWSDSWAPAAAAQVAWTMAATGVGQLGGFCVDQGNIVSATRMGVI